jgi:hypothetical protein
MVRTFDKAWVVAINMGYGHERAAFALKDLAYGDIIVANDYPGIPHHDRDLWKQSRGLYVIFFYAYNLFRWLVNRCLGSWIIF